jgi:hypothetical protein
VKITQHMIDQAKVFANAKVGDEVRMFMRGVEIPSSSVYHSLALFAERGSIEYRIGEPRVETWMNVHRSAGRFLYDTEEEARRDAASMPCSRVAVHLVEKEA